MVVMYTDMMYDPLQGGVLNCGLFFMSPSPLLWAVSRKISENRWVTLQMMVKM